MQNIMNIDNNDKAASYGEPWRQDYLRGRNGFIINAKDDAVTGMNGWQRDEDFFRAIQCVNACAGIADPEKAIQAAREALRQALSTTPSPCRCLRFSEPPHVCNICAALAQLNND